MNHILFATDFGKTSKALFSKIVALAQKLEAKITLFHSMPRPIEPVIQSGVFLMGGGWVSLPDFLDQEEEEKLRLGHAWAEEAKKQGVETQFIFDTKQGGVKEAILETVQARHVNLIAMAAESGPVASALLGSVTRQIVRNAPCPVWVMRT